MLTQRRTIACVADVVIVWPQVLGDVRAYADVLNGALMREFELDEIKGDPMAHTPHDAKTIEFMFNSALPTVRTVLLPRQPTAYRP